MPQNTKNITFLPHTADIRMKISGSSLTALFQAGLMGMNKLINKVPCQEWEEFEHTTTISLEANDVTTLLVDFLSEVLSLTHIYRVIYCKANFTILDSTNLRCQLWGNEIEHFDEDLKAVTYHEAEVTKNQHGHWETIIIFDI